jgi:hypothetical protein
LSLREELVTVLYDLMGAADEVHVVLLQEARYDIRAECEGDTSIVFAPASNVLVRIRPEEIAEETAIGNLDWSAGGKENFPFFLAVIDKGTMLEQSKYVNTYVSRSHDTPDLLHRVEVRAQAAVHGENLLINNGGDG